MNKERIKTIALIIASVIAVICAIGWTVQATKPKTNTPMEIEETGIVQSVALSVTMVQSADGTVSKTVTANISPSNAANKELDWGIAWADGAELSSQEVTDYVTVTPTSDDATTATVTCKQPFRGSSIVITATSRESGAVGYCGVAYNGEPSEIAADDFYFSLSTSYVSVTLNNIFNDVGDEYYDRISVVCQSVSGTVRFGELRINGTDISFVNQADVQATTAMVKPRFNKTKKRVEIDIQNPDDSKVISAEGTAFSCVLEVSCNGITKTITGTFRVSVTKITMDSVTF